MQTVNDTFSAEQLDTLVPTWLDGERPLPSDVTLIPLKTKSFLALLPWTILALFFLTWVVLPLVTLARSFVTEGAGLIAYFAFGAVAMIVMFSVFLYGILSFLIPEYRWWYERRNGRLRHGIFLGVDKLVVRGRKDRFGVEREMVQSAAVVERKRGQRFDKLIELKLQSEEAVMFEADVEATAEEVAQQIMQWCNG